MSRPGIMLYFETYQAMKELTDEEKGIMFTAIMEYSQYGCVPEFPDRFMRGLWAFIQPGLDRDAQKYEETCNSRRKAIQSRWWQKYAEENGIDANDLEAKERWMSSQNTNDTNV